jgi:hypothetical protein
MPPPRLLLVFPSLLILSAIGCARHPRAAAGRGQTSTASDGTTVPAAGREPLVLVVYRRTGGIVGTDDRVVVWSDGFAQVTGRLLGTGSGRVPDDQMERLRNLLGGWEGLASPAASRAPDALVVEVAHAGRSVTADDASPRVPDAFRTVREALESIARQVVAGTDRTN